MKTTRREDLIIGKNYWFDSKNYGTLIRRDNLVIYFRPIVNNTYELDEDGLVEFLAHGSDFEQKD